MRRKDREITDIEQLLQVIDDCKVCRLAMWDEEGPYLVPLNFGCRYEEGRLELFFHSAAEGRKIRAIAGNPRVAFEMDSGHALIAGETACQFSYAYRSIIGTGTVELLEDPEAKRAALERIVEHQTGRQLAVPVEAASHVAVFRLTADGFTGKEHQQR